METSRTGGGPGTTPLLTPLEERVLAITVPEYVFVMDGADTLPPPMQPVSLLLSPQEMTTPARLFSYTT